MDTYIEKGASFKGTRDAKSILGLRVLSISGETVGRVTEVRLHATTNALEGIVVARGLGQRIYFCKRYLSRITDDAVLLDIEPAILLIGRQVISADGKVVGKIKSIKRVDHTNDISTLLVSRPFFGKLTVHAEHIRKTGHAIVLKKTYAECKRGS